MGVKSLVQGLNAAATAARPDSNRGPFDPQSDAVPVLESHLRTHVAEGRELDIRCHERSPPSSSTSSQLGRRHFLDAERWNS